MWHESDIGMDNEAFKSLEFKQSNAHLILIKNFLNTDVASDYMSILTNGIDWQQREIRLFGKTHLEPRLTAWHGDKGVAYTYSGIKNIALPWTGTLSKIKTQAENLSGCTFNSVLLNLYRDGSDGMGWHQDNEKSLGENPVIASVSLGAERLFKFKHISEDLKTCCLLTHGSLLIMKGSTQHYWKHQIPKSRKPIKPRINLTFRSIMDI